MKDESRTNLGALGARLRWLQGELMRLDALADRLDPFSGRQALHNGIDFAEKRGADVLLRRTAWLGLFGYSSAVLPIQ
jgi:hypothetical protein